jgi:hypothetical protein
LVELELELELVELEPVELELVVQKFVLILIDGKHFILF